MAHRKWWRVPRLNGTIVGMTVWQPRPSHLEVGEVLLPAEEISRIVAHLGARITEDYAGRQPLFVAVLKGAFVFMADLLREVQLNTEVDFLAVSSYGDSTTSSGAVRILKDLDIALEGRDVILVEDIIDSGLTLSFLVQNLISRAPASLSLCALLIRKGVTLPEPVTSRLRYVGHELEPGWIVGYGLDAGERNRHLPSIHHYLAQPSE